MTDAGTTQDNLILPSPPVGGLPISQDWLDRTKLVRNRTFPSILPSGKNILVDTMFKISIGYTNLDMRQTGADLAAESALSLPVMPIWLGSQQKILSFLAKFKKRDLRITIPIKGCSSFVDYKARRHESESVKTMHWDATEYFICSRALTIDQISAVKLLLNQVMSWKLRCLMEKPQNFNPVNHLYKQECDHGTCLVFP